MKYVLPVLLTVVGCELCAEPLLQFPSPSFLDAEVVTNLPFEALNSEGNDFKFSLLFISMPSNNVELAFGTDKNNDGFLSSKEASLVVGWDCGAWIVTEPQLKRHTRETASTIGRRTFSFQMSVSHKGVVKSLIVKDGNTDILTNLTQKVSYASFTPKDWDLMRLTARGMGELDETMDFEHSSVGLAIIFR